jgi:hypothetical protein
MVESLAWKCRDLSPEASASPESILKKLYSLEGVSSNENLSLLLRKFHPLAVVNINHRLLVIYDENIPHTLSTQMKPWVYLELDWLERSMLWTLINDKLMDLGLPFHLLCLHSKLTLLIEERDVNLVEYFLRESCGLSFLNPLFQISSSIDSRNYSLLNSLLRFHGNVLPQSLTIHCLGAEPNECEHLSQIPRMYHQLLTVLRALGVRSLSLHFVGPNLLGGQFDSLHLSPNSPSFPFSIHSPLSLELNLFRYCGLYHDYFLHHCPLATADDKIDLLICFNAGLWGYTDWIPTLRLISSLSITQTVITSYTLQESEEDFDVVEDHCHPSPCPSTQQQRYQRLHWNFESELNPFRVREPMWRSSAPPSAAKYFENNYWQSFSLRVEEDVEGTIPN